MAVSAAIVVVAGLFMGAMGLASCEAHGLFLYALEAHQERNRVRRLPGRSVGTPQVPHCVWQG